MGPLAAPASASARTSVVGREPSLAHARRRLSASVRASFVVFVKVRVRVRVRVIVRVNVNVRVNPNPKPKPNPN
jgi:hypothetical protein